MGALLVHHPHGGLDQALAFLLSWHTLDLLCKSWLVNLQRKHISAEIRLSRGSTAIGRGGYFGHLCQSLDSTGDSPSPCFSRKLSMLPIFNSEDDDSASYVRVPACKSFYSVALPRFI